jgi:hypothetical protein
MPALPELVPRPHAYCPCLAHLEWVQGDFPGSSDTIDGRFAHRNEENGDRVERVVPYFVASKQRVTIELDELLADMCASAERPAPEQ